MQLNSTIIAGIVPGDSIVAIKVTSKLVVTLTATIKMSNFK